MAHCRRGGGHYRRGGDGKLSGGVYRTVGEPGLQHAAGSAAVYRFGALVRLVAVLEKPPELLDLGLGIQNLGRAAVFGVFDYRARHRAVCRQLFDGVGRLGGHQPPAAGYVPQNAAAAFVCAAGRIVRHDCQPDCEPNQQRHQRREHHFCHIGARFVDCGRAYRRVAVSELAAEPGGAVRVPLPDAADALLPQTPEKRAGQRANKHRADDQHAQRAAFRAPHGENVRRLRQCAAAV